MMKESEPEKEYIQARYGRGAAVYPRLTGTNHHTSCQF